jgi:hypothetical protein
VGSDAAASVQASGETTCRCIMSVVKGADAGAPSLLTARRARPDTGAATTGMDAWSWSGPGGSAWLTTLLLTSTLLALLGARVGWLLGTGAVAAPCRGPGDTRPLRTMIVLGSGAAAHCPCPPLLFGRGPALREPSGCHSSTALSRRTARERERVGLRVAWSLLPNPKP